MLTGLWPIHHGSREVGDPMRELPTLASELRAHGYATIGVACNANLSRRQRIHLGFDSYVARAMTAEAATDEALRLREHVDPARPLFLLVRYFDPHMPYRPPQDWRRPSTTPDCGQMFRIAK
jgi:arylsulfatase A-like enzyme